MNSTNSPIFGELRFRKDPFVELPTCSGSSTHGPLLGSLRRPPMKSQILYNNLSFVGLKKRVESHEPSTQEI